MNTSLTRRSLLCVALIAAAWISGPAAFAGSASVAAASAWTGTWSAPPQTDGGGFTNQTLRQIVHTSIGGTAARIQISNLFGNSPLTIRDVHIAVRSSGSSITAGTDRTVSFGGSSEVVIAAGAAATSDSVNFVVPTAGDVAVSMYLPNQTGPATGHQSALQTSYIASGDVSGNTSLSGAQTTGDTFFLTNLDVQNSAAQGAVVALGASITDGIASSQDANRRWPNDLATRLNAAGLTVGVLDQGISGNKLLADGAGQSALNRFNRDVLGQPGVRWVIFSDDPINDLGSGSPPTSTQIINAYKQLISSAHQAGVKFLCSTLTPFQGSSGWTQNGENVRQAVDSFIRGSGSGCDGVVDQDTATHDPNNPTRYLPAYDAGDHLHPNTDGLQAIANAVNLGLFGSPGFSSGFEPSDPALTWADTVDPAGGNIGDVTGICCGLKGPEAGVRTGETAHTGNGALMYSGSAQGGSADYAYLKFYDVSAGSLTIGSGTTLSYWIYPQSHATSPYVSAGSTNSTCVSIDMVFADGSTLRDSGAVDQNGNRIHPAHQCGHLALDTWNHVTVNLATNNAGKQINRILVGYDQPGGSGGYRGYVDDLAIG